MHENIWKKDAKMLRRKIVEQLEKYYKSGYNKCVILTGARQVGKTTSIREFAKANYKHFVEVNFIKKPLAIQAFDGDLDTSTIISNLSAMGLGPFVEGETLVFFDEIQECPKARTAIKFLVEENRYDFIASGSLLGINYKEIPSYPVGYEQEISMFPLDFEEFLWAKNIDANILDILHNAYDTLNPVPDFIHLQISKYLREYLVVGGLPEVVQTYISQDDFNRVINIQKSILSSYRTDISKYAGKDKTLVKRVFDAIPAELGKQDKRFILANLEQGASRRKYEDPTQWLIDAGLAYYSFNTKAFELPFASTETHNLYKLYLVDSGLLSCLLLKNLQFSVMNGDISVNEGALTENFVACELSAKHIPLHYYDKKSKHELDFIIEENGAISILEVKSGLSYQRHASLDAAMRTHTSKIARSIVLCTSNIFIENNVIYLPLYMSMFL